jgi:hypothetical protein
MVHMLMLLGSWFSHGCHFKSAIFWVWIVTEGRNCPGLLLCLLFDTEDEGEMFLRNLGRYNQEDRSLMLP